MHLVSVIGENYQFSILDEVLAAILLLTHLGSRSRGPKEPSSMVFIACNVQSDSLRKFGQSFTIFAKAAEKLVFVSE